MKTNYKPRGVSEKLDMGNNNNIIDLFYKKIQHSCLSAVDLA